MVMDTMQIRLSKGLVSRIDRLVDEGLYANRADVIRDGVRRLLFNDLIGILPDTKDSVKEIRLLRNKLSAQKIDLEDINKLAD